MGAARKSGPFEFLESAISVLTMKTSAFRVLKCAMPGVHAVEACSTHSFPRHTHDQFGIGLIRSGAQRSASGRGMVEAGPGMVITVNPGEVHDGLPIGEAGRSWNMLYFDPEALQDVFEGLDRARGAFEFHHPVVDDGDLARRFARLYRAMTDSDEKPLPAEEMALLLMDWLVPSTKSEAGRGGSRIGRARECIDDAPAESVSLSDLADLCGLSRFQFLRSFARATGLTPHAYLLQRRIDRARRLIAAGMPLAEAAADSGFFDQSHMTRHFARVLGVTPGAYALAMH
jgi:AraC-like DNA-binding protein